MSLNRYDKSKHDRACEYWASVGWSVGGFRRRLRDRWHRHALTCDECGWLRGDFETLPAVVPDLFMLGDFVDCGERGEMAAIRLLEVEHWSRLSQRRYKVENLYDWFMFFDHTSCWHFAVFTVDVGSKNPEQFDPFVHYWSRWYAA